MEANIIHHEMEHNSPEWYKARSGKFTASMFGNLFSKKDSVGYRDAINNVVHQIITGEIEPSYSNADMERGHEWEDTARQIYELTTFRELKAGGFWEYNKYVGASPDRLVDDDGILEIKTHKASIMIDVIINKKSPLFNPYQIQGQLLCTGRKWCDFIAFNPNYKPLIIRVERDEVFIKTLIEKLDESIKIVESKINSITK